MVASFKATVRLVLLTLLLSYTVSVALALPASWSKPRGLLPEDPAEDPFYQSPEGFESKAPGTVLRSRTVEVSFLGIIPNLIEAHQVLYRTTAINGSAISTVTTIFKPSGAKTDRFVSFHTAYDSSSVSCDPSYQYQLGSPQTDVIPAFEMLFIETYLKRGYIVASPDYEGPDAAFAPGHLEGMNVLDGMRAVLNYHDTIGIANDSAVVGTGYSGGAIATGWAASLHSSYAPELDVKGWVAGGTPSNLTGTLKFLDDGVFSGFIFGAMVGLSKPSAYGAELVPVIDRIISPKGRETLDNASRQCAIHDLTSFFETSLFTTDMQSMGPSVLQEPTIVDILSKNIMGVAKNETPIAPVFIYHAPDDEVIPYANASTLADSWCNNGAEVHFTSFEAGGHLTTEVVGIKHALKSVESAFAGTTGGGCSRNSTWTDMLEPKELGVELEPVLIKLIDVLHDLGHKDENVVKDVNVLKKMSI